MIIFATCRIDRQSLPAVTTVTSENHEEFKAADKVVVIAYATSESELAEFKATAEAHRDDYLFGFSTDAAATKAAGVTAPAVVLYKSFDEGKVTFPTDASAATSATLSAFIKENSIPLFDEVNGDNYATYAGSGLPLAYLFVDPEDPKKASYLKELTPVAAEYKGKVNFVWIDAVKFVEHAKSLGLTEGQWPALVIQDIETQLKYPVDQAEAPSFAVVSKHVKSYVAGTLEPKLKTQPVPEQTEAFYTLVGSTFEEVVYDDSKDVFVQFSAPWCVSIGDV